MRRRMLGLVLVLTAATTLHAQGGGRIAGRVLSSSGRPVPGAVVRLRDPARSAIADAAGRYELDGVPAGEQRVDAQLAGEGVGSARVTVQAGATARVDVVLSTPLARPAEDLSATDDPRGRPDPTGAASRVEGAQLRALGTAEPLAALQGLVTGVDLLPQNTLAGAAVDVRIRGVRTLDNLDDPLYVLDGVPLPGRPDIGIAGIESVEILKDAAATALYGMDAAAGVVRITTRSGAAGPLRFSVDGYAGPQRARGFARMMDGAQFAAYRLEAARVDGNPMDFSAEELAMLAEGRSTDWQQLIARTGGVRQAAILGGGTVGGTRLGLGGSLFEQAGIGQGQDYGRYDLTGSLVHAFGRLRLTGTFVGSRGAQSLGAGTQLWSTAMWQNPLARARDSAGAPVPTPNGSRQLPNPLLQVEDVGRDVVTTHLFGQALAELRLASGLVWHIRYARDQQDRRDTLFEAGVVRINYGGYDSYTRDEAGQRSTTVETALSLRRTLANGQSFDGMLVAAQQPSRFTRFHLDSLSGSYGYQSGRTDLTARWYLAHARYALRQRYLVSVTARYDGWNILPEGERWFLTRALGVGWEAGEERFVRRLGAFSQLRLRASWGRSARPALLDVADAAGFIMGTSTPERIEHIDLGADVRLLDDRLAAVVDLYRRDSHAQSIVAYAPEGYWAMVPGGATRNQGLELALTSWNLRAWRGLSWTTDLGLTHNRNLVLQLVPADTTGCPPGARPCNLVGPWFVGQPPSDASDPQQRLFYDYKAVGIWQTGDAATAALVGSRPGRIRVADVNGDGKISVADRVIIGSTYPNWVATLGNRFTYRGLDLSVLLGARLGYTIQDPLTANRTWLGRANGLAQDFWTPSNPSGTVPEPTMYAQPYQTTLTYRSGSHWRVRQVTVGWTLPRPFDRERTAALRLYAGARDPWVSGNFVGFDPEAPTLGAPPCRTVYLGASASF